MDYLLVTLRSIVCSPVVVRYPCKVLGRTLYDEDELNNLLETSFYLLTYRMNFEPLPCSTLTSDRGWGCLARASQMLLAHVLRRHAASECHLKFFCDMNDEHLAPFSLHCMTRAVIKHGTEFRADYWAPSQGCEAIRSCVESAVRQGLLTQKLSVVVSSSGTIPEREIHEHLRGDGSVLVLVPVRCGTSRRMTQTMFFALEHLLHIPSCMGVVGGVPNRGYYIVGTSGHRLLYLDPHCMTQNAMVSCELGKVGIVTPTTNLLRSVRWDHVDTSFFFGFLLDSLDEYEKLRESLGEPSRMSIDPMLWVDSGDTPASRDSELMEWPNGL
ncbi:putative Peptidase family C54 [Trypanosoma vivax]|uniref:Cysteine protease n=1 Tax=Trypanosoma vivax (strain Y486) TaxID=1055687 RepID=G0TWI1_TRYVY|nr:putative AUT2/APG4/ATG4 cysteine peptidase [Trypanosoma vivax]KAH8609158.1 putative Peptidase family C54 [Trypanosoma vivax]CCC48319.1 putative AUT2/APG4/ATG4 cysteine peptidase [Trypanosoma vivax Y486]